MEKKRPQLSLAELYQLKWFLGGALALLSAWTVLYMDVEAWLWLILITVAVPAVLIRPSLTLILPRWIHRLAFPLFVALFASDYYFNREPLPAMIRLALMLVFYRAITARRRREDFQLIVLGLFLVVVAGVLSVSLLFAVQIVVFTACALAFLLVLTLVDSAESGFTPPSVPAASPAPPVWMHVEWMKLAYRLREASDWRVTLLALMVFAGVVGLSALLFLALPRVEISNNFFLDRMISRKSRTGFSENVRFGDVVDIQRDNSLALSVDVSDPRAIPAMPYWRMIVLDEYSQGVFSMSEGLRSQIRRQRDTAMRINGTARPRADKVIWTFYLEEGTSRFLPLLGSFYQVQFDGGAQSYEISDELRVLALLKVPSKMFAYRVEDMRFEATPGPMETRPVRQPVVYEPMPESEFGPGQPPVAPPTFLRIDLLSEPDREKLAGWVRQIGAPADDAQAFGRLASAWLERKHAYSLQMELAAADGDPLVRWTGGTEPGHCELFAGAFVMLARTAGYPTRMVTGFKGGAWNARSEHLVIRNADAHAWCEIYDAKAGVWRLVDPTPGGAGPGDSTAAEGGAAALERMRDDGWAGRFDSLRMLWYRRIVNFDQSSQMELARTTKQAIEGRARWLRSEIDRRLEAFTAWLQQPWDLGRVAGWVISVAGGVGLFVFWNRLGRGWWMRWRSGHGRRGIDPVRREAAKWLRRLAEVEDGEAAVVRAELERLRYGPHGSWKNPQVIFRRAKRACAKQARN